MLSSAYFCGGCLSYFPQMTISMNGLWRWLDILLYHHDHAAMDLLQNMLQIFSCPLYITYSSEKGIYHTWYKWLLAWNGCRIDLWVWPISLKAIQPWIAIKVLRYSVHATAHVVRKRISHTSQKWLLAWNGELRVMILTFTHIFNIKNQVPSRTIYVLLMAII